MISAIQFCVRYVEWLELIDHSISPKFYPAIREMYAVDPTDWVSPDDWFVSENEAIGFLYRVVLQKQKQLDSVKA